MREHHRKIILAAMLSLGLPSCSLTGPVRDDPKAVRLVFQAPEASHWESLKERGDADDAWTHKGTGATLALRSMCNRYEHLSVENLSQNLLNIVQDPEIESQAPQTIDGRSAVSTVFHGEVDGVKVQNRLVVLRKDNCVFDFTLTQLGKISPAVMENFDAFLASFRYSGGTAP